MSVYLFVAPYGAHEGMVHLSTDGTSEDCQLRPSFRVREKGGTVGDPKAEDLLALRLAGPYRRCRKCFRYGPKYGRL